jgi:hypothetical protein
MQSFSSVINPSKDQRAETSPSFTLLLTNPGRALAELPGLERGNAAEPLHQVRLVDDQTPPAKVCKVCISGSRRVARQERIARLREAGGLCDRLSNQPVSVTLDPLSTSPPVASGSVINTLAAGSFCQVGRVPCQRRDQHNRRAIRAGRIVDQTCKRPAGCVVRRCQAGVPGSADKPFHFARAGVRSWCRVCLRAGHRCCPVWRGLLSVMSITIFLPRFTLRQGAVRSPQFAPVQQIRLGVKTEIKHWENECQQSHWLTMIATS